MITKPKNDKKRVLIALSGGIDSAVSAYNLIKSGYQVEAAFMKNYSSQAGLKIDACPWLVDRQDALRVAAFLGIPMHTLNFEKQYEKNVMNYFFTEYEAGRTPNPDVMCNKEIKFKMLYNWAIKNNFDYLATGHYAQVLPATKRAKSKKISKLGESYNLVRATDDFKDQTYFIYNIKQSQLPHLLFPIGHLKKTSVRSLAKKVGLPNADKKESMGLCFVGKIRLKEFLDQKLKPKIGSVIDTAGNKIGKHQGLAYYTIGQRQGIKIGQGGPWFVASKDMTTNTLVVTNNPHDRALLVTEVELVNLHWITKPKFSDGVSPIKSIKLTGRYRHQGQLEKVTISKIPTKKAGYKYLVKFSKPQKFIASGQSLVLYQGKICLGGGVIA